VTYEERLAAWAVIFPSKHAGIPNVDAEHFTALELALQELRETRQPTSNTARLRLVVHAAEVLGALGEVEKAGA
jgi:hypothetical protein